MFGRRKEQEGKLPNEVGFSYGFSVLFYKVFFSILFLFLFFLSSGLELFMLQKECRLVTRDVKVLIEAHDLHVIFFLLSLQSFSDLQAL